MAKIVTLQEAELISLEVKKQKKGIVLVGGCFDILHIGHIKFLEEARRTDEILFILLEDDRRIRRLKGNNRPIFSQQERAQVLSVIKNIDYVVLLPFVAMDLDYDRVISLIKPNVIAVTRNDPLIARKKLQAKMVNGKIRIIPYLKTFSSSRLAKILGL